MFLAKERWRETIIFVMKNSMNITYKQKGTHERMKNNKPSMVLHACNSNTREGGS
jgi:hypothetical protein